MNNQWHQHTII